jgi:hypothetical protein
MMKGPTDKSFPFIKIPISDELPQTKRSVLRNSLDKLLHYFFPNGSQALLRSRPISYMPPQELQNRARDLLKPLEDGKELICKKFGRVGEAFVQRHIEPFLGLLRNLARGEAMQGSVSSVEAVLTIKKADQLQAKIAESLLEHTRGVLQEDITFLSSFSTQIVDDTHVSVEHREHIVEELEKRVAPFLQELRQMLSKERPKGTFLDLYQWREKIDEDRQGLQDTALCEIEETIHRWRRTEDPFYKKPTDKQLAYIATVFDKISSNDFQWPKNLFELEEASFFLLRIVENSKQLCLDSRVTNLVTQLTEDIDILFESATHSQYKDILLKVMEHLHSVQDLIAEVRLEEKQPIPEVLP